jgi:hypothetical protein
MSDEFGLNMDVNNDADDSSEKREEKVSKSETK